MVLKKIIDECHKAGIKVEISDQREKEPIRVKFTGDLRTGQDLAAEKMLTSSDGKVRQLL